MHAVLQGFLSSLRTAFSFASKLFRRICGRANFSAPSGTRRCKTVKQRSQQCHHQREKQRGDGFITQLHLISSRSVERIDHQRRRPYAQQARAGQVASLERSRQPRLAQTQYHQCHKFQHKARSIQHNVDGDELFKRQLERQRPRQTAENNADPRHAAAVAAGHDAWQHPVLGHRHRQPGIAHHHRHCAVWIEPYAGICGTGGTASARE